MKIFLKSDKLNERCSQEESLAIEELGIAFLTKDVTEELTAELQERAMEQAPAKYCIPLVPIYSALRCYLWK